MTAVTRVLVVAPEPLQQALLSHLASGGAEVSTNGHDPAQAVVFAPRGPGPARAREAQRDAMQAAAEIAQRSPAHLVAVSSAEVYGVSPYSPGLVDETWEPPSAHANEVAAWWRQFEEDIRGLFPEAALTILRPAPILDGSSYVSRLLRARVAVTLAGHDPSVQLLAIQDL